jgi:pyridoxamine 5'-phosphate oxidase family protein
VKNGNKLVALTIDDLESIDPWKPRVIKVYGTAEVLDHQGRFGPGKYLRVTPKISWSFGILSLKPEGPGLGRVKTVHHEPS